MSNSIFSFFLFLAMAQTISASVLTANEITHQKANTAIIVKSDTKSVKQMGRLHKAEIEPLDPGGEVWRLKFSNQKERDRAYEKIKDSSFLDFAEKDSVITVNKKLSELDKTSDPYWIDQWPLKNFGQDTPRRIRGLEGADIEAHAAWRLMKTNRSVVVGIIDTGVDYNHPDLKDAMWINEAEKNGQMGKDDDGNGFVDDIYGWDFDSTARRRPYFGQLGDPDPMDVHGHGTHCAGIVAATPNNGIGIAGVAPNAKIMALRFMNNDGSGTSSDAYRAIMYGVENGAEILSNSWGSGRESAVINYAVKKAKEAGVLFVAAAGNDGSDNGLSPSFPANVDSSNVISVAASNARDRLASFSNFGLDSVHVAAPGVAIMSTVPTKGSAPFQAFEAYSGTSMATPVVAGIAAVLLSERSEFVGRPWDLISHLMRTVNPIPSMLSRIKSGGRVSLLRALSSTTAPRVDTDLVQHKKVDVRSGRFSDVKFDKVWKVSAPSSTQIKLHFDSILVDASFDVLSLYDENFRLIHTFVQSYPGGWSSPWIPGSAAYIRFANSKVSHAEWSSGQYSSIDEVPWDYGGFCEVLPDDAEYKYDCHYYAPTELFYNFYSEGFGVSSIDYVVEK